MLLIYEMDFNYESGERRKYDVVFVWFCDICNFVYWGVLWIYYDVIRIVGMFRVVFGM